MAKLIIKLLTISLLLYYIYSSASMTVNIQPKGSETIETRTLVSGKSNVRNR